MNSVAESLKNGQNSNDSYQKGLRRLLRELAAIDESVATSQVTEREARRMEKLLLVRRLYRLTRRH